MQNWSFLDIKNCYKNAKNIWLLTLGCEDEILNTMKTCHDDKNER